MSENAINVRRRRRAGPRQAIGLVGLHTAGIIASILCAGPVLLIVLASLRTSTFARISFSVKTWTLQNYSTLAHNDVFMRWIGNSLLVAALVTLLTVVVDMLAAFAFAKINFPGRGILFALMLATLMVPFSATLVPVYLIASHLHMVNHYTGLVIPTVAGPFGVYLLRQFIRDIPDSLIEAARIDGASYLRVFAMIVLPLCRQPMAVLSIFTFVATWNSFLWPLLMAQSEDMMTLPVGIATTNTQFSQNVNGINAATVLSLLPMAILFAAFQRYFVRGVLAGAVKA
ncbi:MAG TPA: carbohydrate ABC transporter permease [Mycobacteriales bacterium]|nr:carbohydrate ABC transporter permease [Mycobacteriales bacterium]